jgi:hypothetical protein
MKGENFEICNFPIESSTNFAIFLKLKKEIKKDPGKGVRSQHWGSIEYTFH